MTHLDNRRAVPEPSLEQDVGIGEQALFERDDDKLTAFESVLEQLTDMLRVLQIQCCVDLIENVHWGRLELEKRHDER